MADASEIASNTVLRATLSQSEARMLWLMQTTVVRRVNRATVEALSKDRGMFGVPAPRSAAEQPAAHAVEETWP